VRLIGFEIEVRSRLPKAASQADGGGVEDNEDMAHEEDLGVEEQLLVFDVTMEVVEGGKSQSSSSGKSGVEGGSGGMGSWSFVPLSVNLKHQHGSSITMSSSGLAALMGNSTHIKPGGYESYDLGVAGQADDQ